MEGKRPVVSVTFILLTVLGLIIFVCGGLGYAGAGLRFRGDVGSFVLVMLFLILVVALYMMWFYGSVVPVPSK